MTTRDLLSGAYGFLTRNICSHIITLDKVKDKEVGDGRAHLEESAEDP